MLINKDTNFKIMSSHSSGKYITFMKSVKMNFIFLTLFITFVVLVPFDLGVLKVTVAISESECAWYLRVFSVTVFIQTKHEIAVKLAPLSDHH